MIGARVPRPPMSRGRRRAAVRRRAGERGASEPLPLDTPLTADLDGDGTDETVSALETQCFTNDGPKPPPCEQGALRSFFITVQDACTSGTVELQALARDGAGVAGRGRRRGPRRPQGRRSRSRRARARRRAACRRRSCASRPTPTAASPSRRRSSPIRSRRRSAAVRRGRSSEPATSRSTTTTRASRAWSCAPRRTTRGATDPGCCPSFAPNDVLALRRRELRLQAVPHEAPQDPEAVLSRVSRRSRRARARPRRTRRRRRAGSAARAWRP